MTPAGVDALREQIAWLERNSRPGDCFADDWRDTWSALQRYIEALGDFLDAERTRATDRLHMRAAVAVAADELAELGAGLAPNAVIQVAVAQVGVRVAAVESMLRRTLERNRTPSEPPPGGAR